MTPPTKTPICKCPRLYKRILPLFLAWCVFSLAIILPLGNPQWSRAVYLFQWKVWPGELPGYLTTVLIGRYDANGIFRYNDYPTTWTHWYSNGRRAMECHWKNGNEQSRVWDRNGRLIWKMNDSGSEVKTMLWMRGQWKESVSGLWPVYYESGVQFNLVEFHPPGKKTWEDSWITQMYTRLKSSP